MALSTVLPTQNYVDEQLLKVTSVRINYPAAAARGRPQETVVVTLTAELLAQLSSMLRLKSTTK